MWFCLCFSINQWTGMRNKLTLLLLLCMSIAASSQDEDVLRPKGRPDGNGSQANTRQSKSKSSKNPWSYGVEVGPNANIFSQSMSGLQKDSRLSVFENGFGRDFFLGLCVDYKLSDNTGIQFIVAYDQKDFSNSKDAIRDAIRPDNSVVDASVTGNYVTRISYLTITPQYRWNITPETFLLVGPTIHLKSGNASQSFLEQINSPEDVYYSFGTPNQSKVIVANTDNLDANSTRVGLEIDFGYKYQLTPKLSLVPKVGFQYMVTAFGKDEEAVDDTKYYTTPPFPGTVPVTATSKALHSLQFSIGIWYNF